MTSRGQCPRGGGACGYLCKISGKSTPLPPLTKAFPYAYVARVRVKVRFRVSYILFKPKWAVGLLDHERAMTISQTPCPTHPEPGGQLNGRQSHMFPIRESKGGGL